MDAGSDGTFLTMKRSVPVRMLKNDFFKKVQALEDSCASEEELEKLLGKGRSKKGMLEGDLTEGELEIGQICAAITDLPSSAELVTRLMNEYRGVISNLNP